MKSEEVILEKIKKIEKVKDHWVEVGNEGREGMELVRLNTLHWVLIDD